MSFIKFLQESDNDTKNLIFDTIDQMAEDEIKELGHKIYKIFFNSDEYDISDFDDFCIDDVKEMVNKLGPKFYNKILAIIQPKTFKG